MHLNNSIYILSCDTTIPEFFPVSIVVYMIVLLYELYFYPSCSSVRNKPLRKAVAENLRILNQLVFCFVFCLFVSSVHCI